MTATNSTSKAYILSVSSVDQIEWPKKLFRNKPPNLYVEVRLGQSVQRTRVIERSMTPTWNEELPLQGSATDSSMLFLSVKHHTSKPLIKDPYVGSSEIVLDRLLEMCENNQHATLELRSKDGKVGYTRKGFITVRLSTAELTQAGEIARANAREDIEHGGISKSAGAADSGAVQGMNDAVGAVQEPGALETALWSVVSKLDIFVNIIDKTSDVHPYANFAWQLTSSLYKAIKGQIERDQNLIDLVMTMDDVCSFVDEVQLIPNKLERLTDIIADILKQTVECAIFIREYTGHGFTARVVKQTFSNTGQAIKDLTYHLNALKQSFDTGIALQTVFVSTRAQEEVEKLVKIENLKHLNYVQMNASSRPECLPDTRQDLLKSMADWLTTPSPGQNIFWLHGLAGSGKSTISTTLAEYFRALGWLGAFLFFDRNNPSSSEPAAVVPTLCYKLASFDPTIRAAVCTQIEHDPSITEASLRVQFTKLLCEPLSSLAVLHDKGPVIVVLDAFDECGNASSRRDLLALLAHDLAKFLPTFRFLITSRREPDIEAAFSRCSNIVTRELDIMNDANVSDISLYLHHHLSSYQGHPIFQLASDWPGEEKIEALTQSSAGLFIWASTAIKFIAEGLHPEQQLNWELGQGWVCH
ncbi:hypothetical protein PILCRDRAFT_7772 [Piloderma croceum F 1598]|uniref:C2 domain-containing protein n=1 Tax=Piloderma croceum (strain F 1598) TaxID=765440 RepID=A0A0C3FEK8_PILCF|nr:hypothetical protein PILCRDRAFT_7772 [Piloderma croceum F 1598]